MTWYEILLLLETPEGAKPFSDLAPYTGGYSGTHSVTVAPRMPSSQTTSRKGPLHESMSRPVRLHILAPCGRARGTHRQHLVTDLRHELLLAGSAR
jgi:hypothetical protein